MKKLLLPFLLFISISSFAFKQIEIVSINKPNASYIEVNVTMRFALPTSLLSSGVPIPNAGRILATYGSYTVDSIAETPFVVITHIETFGLLPGTLAKFKADLIAKWNAINTQINSIALKPYDTLAGAYWDGANWIAP